MFDTQTRLDDAVSPVVGVILMVAVTVILAAVIGSFVLDLGNNVQANPQAGVTFDQTPQGDLDSDGDEDYYVEVQIVSMENADEVIVSDEYASTSDETLTSVGQSVTMDGEHVDTTGDGTADTYVGYDNDDKITVVGTLEGKEAVLQTHTVQG